MRNKNSGEINLFGVVIFLAILIVVVLAIFYFVLEKGELPSLPKFGITKQVQVAESSNLSLDEIKDIMLNIDNDNDLKAYLQNKLDNKEAFLESFSFTWTDRVANSDIVFSGSDFDCAELISQYAKNVFPDGLPNPGIGNAYTIEVIIDLNRGMQNIQIKVN